MESIPVCDPHFHLWNVKQRPNPNLGEGAEKHLSTYLADDYLKDMAALPAPLKLASSVHVETVVGQTEGGFVLDPVGETRWVCEQMSVTDHPFGVVAYVHLARDTEACAGELRDHREASGDRLRGVRMILNYHESNPMLTWPQVERGDFMDDPAFHEGIALLGEHGLSFDLQCNPGQLSDAVRTFADYPKTPVVLDHIGSYADGANGEYEEMWRRGMRALSDIPHVSVKLSMLWFARNNYQEDVEKEAKIRDLVLETIDTFGPDRCMFATNYPVDRIQGIDVPTLYGQFLKWTEGVSDADRRALFHDTAARVYRL